MKIYNEKKFGSIKLFVIHIKKINIAILFDHISIVDPIIESLYL